MRVMYPDGYDTRMVTIEQMRAKYTPKMHPEFARRLFPWIESMDGLIGIGNGWRDKQPNKPGFAPDGQSFHQSQTWASGIVAYAAVDLVARAAVGNPNPAHRSPTWAESATSPAWGVYTFVANEPWHMQCIETRGWQSWVNAGRPDPQHFTLPGPPPIEEDDDMAKPEDVYIAKPPADATGNPPWFVVERFGGSIRYATNFENPTIEQVVLNAEQYANLRASVGI